MHDEPLGLVGLGGYAGYVGRFLVERMALAGKPLRLAAVYDPTPDAFPELLGAMRAKGVRVCASYAELLDAVKAVWLPVPIDLHLPYTEQALRAGKPVLCEKPAAGCIQDIDAMIRARDAASLPVAVGFQDIYAESSQSLKEQTLSGAFGRITGATLLALWPRDAQYYERPWAGKLSRNGVWILDSPANNALAHFVHLVLYWLGPTARESALPVAVEAELYRVNRIENYDTCCLRITLASGLKVLACLTHACAEHQDPVIAVEGDDGSFIYDYGAKMATIRWSGVDLPMPLTPNTYEETLAGFEGMLLGKDVTVATLEMARMHGLVISGASQCAPVHDVDAAHHQETRTGERTILRRIDGIEELFRTAIRQKRRRHERRKGPWTRPAGRMDLRNYTRFEGPAVA